MLQLIEDSPVACRSSAVAFSSDDKLVAAGSLDKSIIKWDTESGYFTERLDGPEGHYSGVFRTAFFPSGRPLVSTSLDKTIKTWNHPFSIPAIREEGSDRKKCDRRPVEIP